MKHNTILIALHASMIDVQMAMAQHSIDTNDIVIITGTKDIEQHIPRYKAPMIADMLIIASIESYYPEKKHKQQFYKPYHNKFSKGRR